MKKLVFLLFLLLCFLQSCEKLSTISFKSDWEDSPDGVWVGADCWANRLQDWAVKDGRLECLSTKPFRTVHLMSSRVASGEGSFRTSVNIFTKGPVEEGKVSSAGVMFGAGGTLDYRAASLIFHSTGEGAGIYAGLDSKGNLFIRDLEQDNYHFIYNSANNKAWSEARLIFTFGRKNDKSIISVLAVNPYTNIIIDKIESAEVPYQRLSGNTALVSHSGGGEGAETRFAFSDWKVSGSRLEKNTGWSSGPLVTAQYTLSRNILKLTAQLMPLGNKDITEAVLQLREEKEWVDAARAKADTLSYTVTFKTGSWNKSTDVPFRIAYTVRHAGSKTYFLEGMIKHDPVEKNDIRMISLSCIEQIIRPDGKNYRRLDSGHFNYLKSLLYPHAGYVENLKKHKPDLLFFAGDQVYEGASPTSPDLENAKLDYLYKWYLWGLTYRELTLNIPAITIPDDHDVYHGNLWGAGGIAVPEGLSGSVAQDAGGYKMPPEFVNMVQATQTSHLPDPVDPEPVAQGIKVYFTECNIGGVSMAVIEDRKFKSAPKALLPQADISDGWPRNKYWSTRYYSRIEGASLLGDRQIKFLEGWAADWSGRSWMKVALSQTLFANLATIPRDSMSDEVVPVMPVPDSGVYIDGDKLATDFDSDGWPQNGRDNALKILRKAFAIHIAGDQHLGSTVQYGIENFRDASFAIISPATGNIWPRHWFPPYEGMNRRPGWPKNFGDFEDGFGNKITVYAVANPQNTTIEPVRHNTFSTGYSTIVFYRDSREIELTNWPYYADPERDKPFPFWPVRVNQLDNYAKAAAGWLPEIKVEGMNNPVVRVIREYTGELVYSLRIANRTFQPKVFEMGNYTIEVGDPDENKWQKVEKLYPTIFKEREPLTIKF